MERERRTTDDMILVKTGGISVEGVVIEGNTAIDESALTNAF